MLSFIHLPSNGKTMILNIGGLSIELSESVIVDEHYRRTHNIFYRPLPMKSDDIIISTGLNLDIFQLRMKILSSFKIGVGFLLVLGMSALFAVFAGRTDLQIICITSMALWITRTYFILKSLQDELNESVENLNRFM